tara:strand:- start:11 stop:754 length:744 start_codon:yes stop_codon:yes gene_type:complete
MGYFRELPDLQYQSPLLHKKSSRDYVLAKNLFRRVKLLDWLSDISTVFDKYQIEEGERPDNVARKLYGKATLDWVVLITANITNSKDQWPLSNEELYQFASEKYGTTLNDIHHYETRTVKDAEGRLILKGGQVVDSTFTIPAPYEYQTSSTSTYTRSTASYSIISEAETLQDTSSYSAGGDINPTTGISNWEYETRKNTEKRSIYLLRPLYLQQFLNDMRIVMHYDKSSQRLNPKTIRTENTRLTGP